VPIDAPRLTALFAEHEHRLRRFVVGILRDRTAAEDVVQSAFAKAAQAADNIEPGAVKSWLYRTAFNEAMDWKRREGVDRRAALKLMAIGDRRSVAMPDARLVQDEIVDQVRRAMQSLSPLQQRVVRQRVYDEKKFAEIAAAMNAPPATVATHMRRALETLRKKLVRKDDPT